jgi:hypothetical protein
MAIRYDNYVKRPNQEVEYTQEMVDEMIKCKEDVMYFVTNYVKIVTLDYGEVLFDPRDYQVETLKILSENQILYWTMGKTEW